MGDLYLHLGFARRARFADGLHPIAVEALVRAPGAVILGATLPSLPEVEHKGASFFRRLFMPGKQKRAFWMKALEPAGSPSLELALAVMQKGKGPKPGGMARFALGLGVLSHQVLHARVGDVTASLEGAQRDAMKRALARVWLAETVPNTDALAAELKPTLSLEDNPHAYKALLEHLNGALREAHGDAPGTETLGRWLRGLCVEVEPLVDRATLPPSLGVTDDDARAKHGEALFAAVDDARRWFVLLVNQLAPLFLGGDPSREQMRGALVDENDALLRPDGDEAPSAAAFRDALVSLRREHLSRGRNPKPAYDEVSGASDRAPPVGMPPVPEDASGPLLRVPAHTQEVSVADIEAELKPPPEFSAPAHTQEVSVAQIEEQLAGQGAPPAGATPPTAPTSTQQVSLDDIQEELAAQAPAAAAPPPAPTSTQQVSLDQIEAELAQAAPTAPQTTTPPPTAPPSVPTSTQQVSLDQIEAELAQAAPPTASANAAPPNAAPPPAAPPSVPTSTQQVSLDQIEAELAHATVPQPQPPGAPFLAGAVPVPPPTPLPTTPSAQAPTSAPTATSAEQTNGVAAPADGAPDEKPAAAADEAGEKVREGTDPAGV